MTCEEYRRQLLLFVALSVLTCGDGTLLGQPASPSNWLYPLGNAEATRSQAQPSLRLQSFDSLGVKWDRTDIFGRLQPLIGNIVNNDALLPGLPWAPNEIVALASTAGSKELVVVGGDGKLISRSLMPSNVKGVSVLIDSTAILPDVFTTFPVIIGLETIEQVVEPEVGAHAFVAAYIADSNRVDIIKQLTVDLRPFDPNNAASISPVFGRSANGEMLIYATVNMSQPFITDPNPVDAPFFRGLAQFKTSDFTFPFPQPNILDDTDFRYTVGPEVSFAAPSLTAVGQDVSVLLPCKPSANLGLTSPIFPNFSVPPSSSDQLYLFDLSLTGDQMAEGLAWSNIDNIVPASSFGVQARSMFVELEDAGAGGGAQRFVLVAEEYDARNDASGTARLHLFNDFGSQLTLPPEQTAQADSSFSGIGAHLWSIAVGDVDGFPIANPSEFFPNNPGNEIVVTQSSPQFSVVGNHLSVLRYRTGDRIPKPNLSGDELYFLDTIATQPVNGWVAAVNDFDGDIDGKAEIFLVDNSSNTLRVMRLRDADQIIFWQGEPFETVWEFSFEGEAIESLAVADVDGDGLNDILVTTFSRIYLIGTPVTGRFVIIDPARSAPPPAPYCPGDTVRIRWVNLLGGTPFVNVFFQPYVGGLPQGPRVLVNGAPIVNSGDTVQHLHIVPSADIRGEGRFIVESSSSRDVRDSTAIVDIGRTAVSLDTPFEGQEFLVGDDVLLSGDSDCSDEVLIQISTTGSLRTDWQDLTRAPVAADGSYSTTTTVPCLPFFRCLEADVDSVLRFRALAVRFGRPDAGDTSDTRSLIVRPDTLSIAVDPPPDVVCPERTFQLTNIPIRGECDSLTFAISIDSGRTFIPHERLAGSATDFVWIVAPDLPDTIIARFCCADACVRQDIELTGARLQYVDVVAPNPFDPENGSRGGSKPGVNVVYTVPEELEVTIRIFDQSNRLVAMPVENQMRIPDRTYCDNWDGFIERGVNVAPNGMYYMILEFSNGDREVFPVFVAKGY